MAGEQTAAPGGRPRPRAKRLVPALTLLLPSLSPCLGLATVDWPQTAITSLATDRQLVRVVATRHFGYHALSPAGKRRLALDLERQGCGATIDQAVCVRNLLYKLQLDTQRAAIDPRDLAAHYDGDARGRLRDCAMAFQTAPLEVVRALVRHKYGLSSVLSRKVVEHTVAFVGTDAAAAARLDGFRDHLAASPHTRRLPSHAKREVARFGRELGARDWAEFVWACRHDMQGLPKQRTMDEVERMERTLERRLRADGVRFRTERDLRLDRDGERRSTPDVVFDDPAGVTVAGREGVRWVDVKRMYGTVSCGPASDALAAQLAKTAARYTADWGPGALVLIYGFCEALADRLEEELGPGHEGVQLLSAASLGVGRAADARGAGGGEPAPRAEPEPRPMAKQAGGRRGASTTSGRRVAPRQFSARKGGRGGPHSSPDT